MAAAAREASTRALMPRKSSSARSPVAVPPSPGRPERRACTHAGARAAAAAARAGAGARAARAAAGAAATHTRLTPPPQVAAEARPRCAARAASAGASGGAPTDGEHVGGRRRRRPADGSPSHPRRAIGGTSAVMSAAMGGATGAPVSAVMGTSMSAVMGASLSAVMGAQTSAVMGGAPRVGCARTLHPRRPSQRSPRACALPRHRWCAR